MPRRKASEIPKAELVKMIAKLRGVVAEIYHVGEQEMPDMGELERALAETSFDDDLNETYSEEPGNHKSWRIALTMTFDHKNPESYVRHITKAKMEEGEWTGVCELISVKPVAEEPGS